MQLREANIRACRIHEKKMRARSIGLYPNGMAMGAFPWIAPIKARTGFRDMPRRAAPRRIISRRAASPDHHSRKSPVALIGNRRRISGTRSARRRAPGPCVYESHLV